MVAKFLFFFSLELNLVLAESSAHNSFASHSNKNGVCVSNAAVEKALTFVNKMNVYVIIYQCSDLHCPRRRYLYLSFQFLPPNNLKTARSQPPYGQRTRNSLIEKDLIPLQLLLKMIIIRCMFSSTLPAFSTPVLLV